MQLRDVLVQRQWDAPQEWWGSTGLGLMHSEEQGGTLTSHWKDTIGTEQYSKIRTSEEENMEREPMASA